MPSKAHEYKERLAKLSAPKFLLNDDDGRNNLELASVTPDGDLKLRNTYIDANEALKEEFERIKKKTQPDIFRQEYECEWISFQGKTYGELDHNTHIDPFMAGPEIGYVAEWFGEQDE